MTNQEKERYIECPNCRIINFFTADKQEIKCSDFEPKSTYINCRGCGGHIQTGAWVNTDMDGGRKYQKYSFEEWPESKGCDPEAEGGRGLYFKTKSYSTVKDSLRADLERLKSTRPEYTHTVSNEKEFKREYKAQWLDKQCTKATIDDDKKKSNTISLKVSAKDDIAQADIYGESIEVDYDRAIKFIESIPIKKILEVKTGKIEDEYYTVQELEAIIDGSKEFPLNTYFAVMNEAIVAGKKLEDIKVKKEK